MVRDMDAFLHAARGDMDKVRENLSEVLLAQGYQDLSGQIIRGVMKLVTELEIALVDLVRLAQSGGANARGMFPTKRGAASARRFRGSRRTGRERPAGRGCAALGLGV